jgi:hypothetical protein
MDMLNKGLIVNRGQNQGINKATCLQRTSGSHDRIGGCMLVFVAAAALSGCSTPPPWVKNKKIEEPPKEAPAGPSAESPVPQLQGPLKDASASANATPAAVPQPTSTPPDPAGVATKQPPPQSAVPQTKFFPGTGEFVKRAPPPPPTPAGPEEFNLNFEATDIRAIVQTIMGDYMRESFSIHPQTAGTATIRFARPVSRKDLIPILEMLLRQNGQIMIREEGIYKVMPSSIGIRGSATPQVAGSVASLPNGYSVQVVQMKFVGVGDMKRILEPYAVDAQTSIRTDDPRNLLILSGTQRELKHLLEIIDLFDVDFLNGYSVGLFPMSTDVKALAGDLDRIFGPNDKSPLAGIVRIIPIERMNGLLVVTTQSRYLEEARKWIERLDKSGGGAGGVRLNVYPVQHGKADKLAQLLGEVYGNRGGTRAAGATPSDRCQPGGECIPKFRCRGLEGCANHRGRGKQCIGHLGVPVRLRHDLGGVAATGCAAAPGEG